jgi:xanthine dehydrogenase accessory factor
LTVADRLLELAHTDERAVVFTVVEGPGRGSKLLVLLDRDEVIGEGPDELVALAPEIRRNHVFELGEAKIFAEVYGPPPRLVVVGAVDTAEALCALARGIGWHTVCVDARAAFATPERIPSADDLVVAWPQDAFERVPLDRDTAVVTLAHDDRFDIPTLVASLRSDCFYVGAIGSRRTQERRRERLLAEGLTEAELERIHGPAGLDIGAESPAETALAILAEALAARVSRGGLPLRGTAQRIHVER